MVTPKKPRRQISSLVVIMSQIQQLRPHYVSKLCRNRGHQSRGFQVQVGVFKRCSKSPAWGRHRLTCGAVGDEYSELFGARYDHDWTSQWVRSGGNAPSIRLPGNSTIHGSVGSGFTPGPSDTACYSSGGRSRTVL